MITIIGNQKGGVGKSTLAVLAANYLTIERGATATIIDMDYQQSVSQKYEKAKVLENDEPYEVFPATLESYPILSSVLHRNASHAILIDLPGKLDDDGLLPVFESADLVICPFAYDEFTYQSTVLFTVVLKKINPKIEIVFVPNRIKANAKFEIMTEVNAQLQKLGQITAPIPDRVDFQRITTVYTPVSLVPVVYPVFEQIFEARLWKK
ncbi:ParA family protein [Mucilaginibacter terrae]|uniref:Chromosome partitioning protein n=1 Tax=Mucilaginibacter terrae TaxID=1955052 RepID=A0ABU3GRL1_9SPHI|nr:ParA family protein [Mucilaginibacter terrae]MDT3401270.1 chromosome partitioning protein [Mucilaginibacter terrae]